MHTVPWSAPFRPVEPQPFPTPPHVPQPPLLVGAVPQQAGGSTADAAVVERLLAERIVFVDGQLDDAAAHRVVTQLLLLDAIDDRRAVTVYLSSPSGSATAAIAVLDALTVVRAEVATWAVGLVAATAQLLLTAGTPGRRHALPHARIGLRRPTGGSLGALGDAGSGLDVHGEVGAELAELTAEHTGQSVERVLADTAAGRWFTAAEAVEYGLVDHAGATAR